MVGFFFAPFCLKTVMDFAHFGLESGMVFEGNTRGVYERILSFHAIPNEKEMEICEFQMDFKKFFYVFVLH